MLIHACQPFIVYDIQYAGGLGSSGQGLFRNTLEHGYIKPDLWSRAVE